MKQWNYTMVDPKLHPKPLLCFFCENQIGADKPERRFWPIDPTDDERSRIGIEFGIPLRGEEFGLCEECFVRRCGGQHQKAGEAGRTEETYSAPGDWLDSLAQAHDAYLRAKRPPG